MPDSQLVCVVDTSVLIDLNAGGVLYPVFRLPLTLVAPDTIIAELREPDGESLLGCGLTPIELTGPEVREVHRLASLYRSPSVNDLFALVAAKKLGATLLTSDRHLRKAAEQEGVTVRGTLWVLDEMVRVRLFPQRMVSQALRRIVEDGRRLPRHECEKRIRQWT